MNKLLFLTLCLLLCGWSNSSSVNAPYRYSAGWPMPVHKLTSPQRSKRNPPKPAPQQKTVTLVAGGVTPASMDNTKESSKTVCAGDKVNIEAIISAPKKAKTDEHLFSWRNTGGRIIGEGQNVVFDSTGLAPGDYTATVKVETGRNGSHKQHLGYDSITVRVTSCPPLTVCFSPNLDVTVDKSSVDAGERVTLSTPGVTGGRNPGPITYVWTASAGNISSSGLSVTLDTTGLTPGTTVEVTVRATSDTGNCSASGTVRVGIRN